MQKHNTRDIQNKKELTLFFARLLSSRLFWVISPFIKLNIDFRRSKSRKFNKQTHQRYYMCMRHTVNLFSLCKWKRPKWLFFFVVKRYAVREAKNGGTQYARGCHPHSHFEPFVPDYNVLLLFSA